MSGTADLKVCGKPRLVPSRDSCRLKAHGIKLGVFCGIAPTSFVLRVRTNDGTKMAGPEFVQYSAQPHPETFRATSRGAGRDGLGAGLTLPCVQTWQG